MSDEQKVNEPKKASNRSTTLINVGIFFSTFAVVVMIAAFGYGYSVLSKVNVALATTVSELQKEVANGKNELSVLQSTLQTVKADNEKTKELNSKQEQQINDWQDAEKGNLGKWHVAEAEYLVKLANDQIIFTHNTLMAITLLQRAESILESQNDNNLAPIKKSLTETIRALTSQPQVDPTQLYILLTALNHQVMEMPLPASPMQSANVQPESDVNAAALSWWRAGLHNTWDVLKKIVIVRYNVSHAPPLVMPEEKEFLYQNLRAQIETAIWGALHNDKQIYQGSLDTAMLWVRQYYDLSAPTTRAVLARLEELKKLYVEPAGVNLTPTLEMFDKYVRGRVRSA